MRETILVDSNALIALFDGDKALAELLFASSHILVPSIVCGEIDAGALGDTKRERATRCAFEKFLSLSSVSVVSVTRKTGELYARVYGFCRTVGHPIPTNDIWIAALALETAAPILTDDRQLLSLPMIRAYSWI